jgi:hypothetical protein
MSASLGRSRDWPIGSGSSKACAKQGCQKRERDRLGAIVAAEARRADIAPKESTHNLQSASPTCSCYSNIVGKQYLNYGYSLGKAQPA